MILLDTHVIIWLGSGPDRISEEATKAMKEARMSDRELAICSITLLELATLATKGRLEFNENFERFLSEIEQTFVVLPITPKACAKILELPTSYPNDPADRIIGATAIAEGLPLVTADRDIRRSRAVRTIW
jgi:PIN domain nuclease of toxin-antitoxin system